MACSNVTRCRYASRLWSRGDLVQVWRKGGGFVPLALYAAQLALNLAWSPIFFKKHQLGFALADITGALLPGARSRPACDLASIRCTASLRWRAVIALRPLGVRVSAIQGPHESRLRHRAGALTDAIGASHPACLSVMQLCCTKPAIDSGCLQTVCQRLHVSARQQ